MAVRCPLCDLRGCDHAERRAAAAAYSRALYHAKSKAERTAKYAGLVRLCACGVRLAKSQQTCRACLPKCAQCAAPIVKYRQSRTRFCSMACYGASIRIYTMDDRRSQRRARERSAPGLNAADRKRLLSKWRGQQRECAYCPARATTIDHVIPLALGGTNGEGNLVPACLSCNSKKGARLLIHWRISAARW